MENAGHRVVEFLEREYAPLAKQRIVVVCGKGNNGGDGLVVARQLFTRVKPKWLRVVLAGDPAEMHGDALENYQNAQGRRLPGVARDHRGDDGPRRWLSTLCSARGWTDAAQGTSGRDDRCDQSRFPAGRCRLRGCSFGRGERFRRTCRTDVVRAKHTVTFTAPKPCLVLSRRRANWRARCTSRRSEVRRRLYEGDPSILLSVSRAGEFSLRCSEPRPSDSNKGMYGHVLVIAGGRGKTGAAAMAGIAALRSGAGLGLPSRRRHRQSPRLHHTRRKS